MSALKRWKEPGSTASAELRELLEHAHNVAPRPEQAAAVTEGVLAKLAPSAPGTAATASSASGLSAALGKLAAFATIAGLGAALGVFLYRSNQVTPGAALPLPPPAPRAEQTGAADVATASPPTERDDVHSSQLASPTGPAQRPRGKDQRGANSPRAKGTSDELALLHAARRAHRQAAPRALALLHEHERRFPESSFREEREALLIELMQRFDPAEAAARLAAFEARYPHSAYRPHIGQAGDATH